MVFPLSDWLNVSFSLFVSVSLKVEAEARGIPRQGGVLQQIRGEAGRGANS